MSVPPTPRVPPRFVPTLTEVVQEGTAAQAPALPAAATRTHFAAPLSDAQAPLARATPAASPIKPADPPNAAFVGGSGAVQRTAVTEPGHPPRPVLSKDFEELLVHRVMQRVDISLDIRLRGAIARVVDEQTRSIVPRVREEIEAVVRHAVYEAVADELAADVEPEPL